MAGSARPENELCCWGGGESGSQRRRRKKKKHKRPMESEMRKKEEEEESSCMDSLRLLFSDDKDVNIFSGNLFAQFLFFPLPHLRP